LNKNRSTVIMQIDDEGKISELASYILPPKNALIAFRRQNEFHDYNTWNYPNDDNAIKKTPGGNYAYTKRENTIVFTREEKE